MINEYIIDKGLGHTMGTEGSGDVLVKDSGCTSRSSSDAESFPGISRPKRSCIYC